MKSIAIVGAGIAGLSIAHAIRKLAPEVRVIVLERGQRAGGNIRSELTKGYLCEWGPDGFLDNAPETLALARAVGVEHRLLPSSDAARRRFIYRHGRLNEVPTSPVAFLSSPLLSVAAKARIFGEPFARSRPERDETIFDFAARRIGTEAASAMIDSMVSGIFAGDARSLSLRACFPKMWQLETDHGGLFRALLATRKRRRKGDAVGAPAGRLTSFDAGMETLIRGAAEALGGSLRTSSGVESLRRGRATRGVVDLSPAAGFTLATAGGTVEADAVVLAGPATESAALIRPFDADTAALLAGIPTASLAVVCLGYDEQAIAAERGPLAGFGFLVPRSENIRILGALWETSIYPGHRAPEGKALVRVMIGGALDPEAVVLDDEQLIAIVRADLVRTMGLKNPPEFVRIIRHARGIPQYTVGHLARLERIGERLQAHPGLLLAGNSYHGVSINSCIAEADRIAEGVLLHVRATDQRLERVS
jgi:protoporphyrinogen/coproporphyrinogen III oxidase